MPKPASPMVGRAFAYPVLASQIRDREPSLMLPPCRGLGPSSMKGTRRNLGHRLPGRAAIALSGQARSRSRVMSAQEKFGVNGAMIVKLCFSSTIWHDRLATISSSRPYITRRLSPPARSDLSRMEARRPHRAATCP